MRAAMKKAEKRALKKRGWKDNGSWQLLLLCIPALLGYILFNYIPILVSILIPFKDYKFSVGILDSAWVGLKNFKWMLTATSMQRVIRNTVLYGIWFLVIGPVVNVLFALLLFEIKNRTRLKFYQTVITFPNFMSMVIVGCDICDSESADGHYEFYPDLLWKGSCRCLYQLGVVAGNPDDCEFVERRRYGLHDVLCCTYGNRYLAL